MIRVRTAALALMGGVLALVGCTIEPTGTALLTGGARPPTLADEVRIYLAADEVPGRYEVLGLVTARAARGSDEQASIEQAAAELRARAATLGATGIILDKVTQTAAIYERAWDSSTTLFQTYTAGQNATILAGRAIYEDPPTPTAMP